MQGGRKSGAKAKGKREGEEREKGGPQGDKAHGAQDHPAPERSQAHGNAGAVADADAVAAVDSFWRELDAKSVGLVRSPLWVRIPMPGSSHFSVAVCSLRPFWVTTRSLHRARIMLPVDHHTGPRGKDQ